MSECLCLVELPVKVIERPAAHVRRWRAEAIPVENFPQARGRHPKIIHRPE
jgi:hypothetical protein